MAAMSCPGGAYSKVSGMGSLEKRAKLGFFSGGKIIVLEKRGPHELKVLNVENINGPSLAQES